MEVAIGGRLLLGKIGHTRGTPAKGMLVPDEALKQPNRLEPMVG
jgi:hypothetical protein